MTTHNFLEISVKSTIKTKTNWLMHHWMGAADKPITIQRPGMARVNKCELILKCTKINNVQTNCK